MTAFSPVESDSYTEGRRKAGRTVSLCPLVLMYFCAGDWPCPVARGSRQPGGDLVYLGSFLFIYPLIRRRSAQRQFSELKASACSPLTPAFSLGLVINRMSYSCQEAHALRFMKLTSVLTWPCLLKIPRVRMQHTAK